MSLLSYIIDVKDRFSSTFAKFRKDTQSLGLTWSSAWDQAKNGNFTGLLSMITKFAPVLGVAAAAVKGLGAAWKFVSDGLAENAKLEKLAIRLSVVTGSVKLAREEIERLTKGKYAVDDLFDEEDIINGAISLKRLSNGILGTAGDMQKLAGVAYTTGQSISEVSQNVGMITTMILGGDEAWGRYAKQLIASGAVSEDVINQMKQMQTEGKGAGDMVAYLWANLNGGNVEVLNEARKTIEGIRKAADDAAGDAAKALGVQTVSFVGLFHKLRGEWYRTIEWFANHKAVLSASIVNPLLMPNAIAASKLLPKDPGPAGGDATSAADIIAKGNSKNNEPSDAAKAEAKKIADTHADLLKKKEEAQKRYDEAQRTREEQLIALQGERLAANASTSMNTGSDAEIQAATRVLELDTEILKIKKEIADEEKRYAQEAAATVTARANAEQAARRGRLVDESQAQYHRAYDQMKPEDRLAQTEKNIGNWNRIVGESQTEEKKAAATKNLLAQLQERDKVRKEIADRDAVRKAAGESLMSRDRDLRESAMSPNQQLGESRRRQAEIKKQLAGEQDPDKRLELRSRLMDEAEKQAGLASNKGDGRFARSIGIGDIFTKRFGQDRKQDPAEESAHTLKRIEATLKDIKQFGPGGFGR